MGSWQCWYTTSLSKMATEVEGIETLSAAPNSPPASFLFNDKKTEGALPPLKTTELYILTRAILFILILGHTPPFYRLDKITGSGIAGWLTLHCLREVRLFRRGGHVF